MFHGLNGSGGSLVVEIGGGGGCPGADSSASSRRFISFTDVRRISVS
jgi:hypothetical protein